MSGLPTLQIRMRAGIVELGPGQPDGALLPGGLVREAVEATLAADGAAALGYGAAAGPAPLREWLAGWLSRREGRAVGPEEVLVTGGSSSGLAHLCQAFTRPGDVVLCESPTYHLAARTFRDFGLEPIGVAGDGVGVSPAALATALAAAGGRAAMVYTVPAHNNPTGRTTTPARRAELLALASRAEVLVVEDDVYRELTYDDPLPPLGSRPADEPGVVRLGSFAKLVAPGLRVGWLTTAPERVERLAAAGWLDSGGGPNHFTAMALARIGSGGAIDRHLVGLRAAYAERRDVLALALREALPAGSSVAPAAGGFFLWVTLPAGADAAAFLPHAEAAGVGYVPGARFGLPGAPVPHASLRVAFCAHPVETLREGARRLGRALSELEVEVDAP